MAELSYAVRSLSRSPGFAVVTTLTLGLAIGANASIFSVVDGVLLEPLPYGDADRLVAIVSSAPGNPSAPPEFGVSPEFYVSYAEDTPGLESVAIYTGTGGTLRIGDAAERAQIGLVTPSFFEALGVEPVVGRLPATDDVAPSAFGDPDSGVVLISHALWVQSFGADPLVAGKTVELNGIARTIVGVLPSEMDLPSAETSVWLPVEFDAETVQAGQFSWTMIGRATAGTTSAALEAQLAPIVARFPELYGGGSYGAFLIEGRYAPVVRPLKEEIVGDLEQPLWILLGTVSLVLLIACSNVANLFLVRAESRQRETAVRAAMGASRFALVRTHLAEALVLATAGGVLGILIAWVGVPLLVASAPSSIPRIESVGLDPGVLGFTAAVSLASALLFGRSVLRPSGSRPATAGWPRSGRRPRAPLRAKRARNFSVRAGPRLVGRVRPARPQLRRAHGA